MLDQLTNYLVVDDGRNILQKYGWHIVFTFLTLYYFRDTVLAPLDFLNNDKRVGVGTSARTSPDSTANAPSQRQGLRGFGKSNALSHRERMMKARQAQQEKAQKDSDAAKEKNQLKKKERMKELAEGHKKKKDKVKKDHNPYKRDSYNPLAPSGGACSYRPARKGVNRGG